jgi:hypothetical protein
MIVIAESIQERSAISRQIIVHHRFLQARDFWERVMRISETEMKLMEMWIGALLTGITTIQSIEQRNRKSFCNLTAHAAKLSIKGSGM